MEISCFSKTFTFVIIILVFHNARYVNGGDTCRRSENGHIVEEYCDYGCCGSGNDESCCSISTSVLLVACIVGGLVLLALVASFVVCCYKNYKDKQTTRVRNLQQQQPTDMNAPRNPGVEPPKPPSYVSAPPAYSEEMPESHFRPATVTGNVSYNQRFRGTNTTVRDNAQGTVSMTTTSGRHPAARSFRNMQIPGSIEEAPPPYTEFARGQTPAHRRRRFIRTPVEEASENTNRNNVGIGTVSENTDILSEIADGNEARDQETRMQQSANQSSRSANESRVDTIRENESRAETVTRILRPSRISRIPTRVHGIHSRQLSDVQSRGSSILTRQTFYSENSPNPNAVRENINLSEI